MQKSKKCAKDVLFRPFLFSKKRFCRFRDCRKNAHVLFRPLVFGKALAQFSHLPIQIQNHFVRRRLNQIHTMTYDSDTAHWVFPATEQCRGQWQMPVLCKERISLPLGHSFLLKTN